MQDYWKSLHWPKLNNKKFIAGLVILLMLGLEASLVPVFIDKEAIKNEVIHSFKLATGLNMEIQGETNLQMFPLPHMTISYLFVHNAPNASSPFLLTIQLLEVRPSLLSLFSKKPVLEDVKINGVAIELERMKNDQMSWQAIASTEAKTEKPLELSSVLKISNLSFSDAAIHYTDSIAGTVVEYSNINGNYSNSEKKQNVLNVTLSYLGKPFIISAHIDLPQLISSNGASANINISSGKTSLTYDGTFGITKSGFVNGDLRFETDDIATWINLLNKDTGKLAKKATEGTKPLPFQLTSKIATQDNKIILPNITFAGSIIKGALQAEIVQLKHVNLQGTIDALDLETIFGSALFGSAKTDNEIPKTDFPTSSYTSPDSFWNNITLAGNVKFNDIVYNNQHLKDTHLDFDITGGEMTISQASSLLPGTSRLIFAGIGKEGYQGFTLEGQLDAAGDDFAQMLQLFKSRSFSLPPDDFKRFRIKTNAVISSTDIRLSEITARIENMGIIGGIIAKFGDRTKLEAALEIGGINLDHFIKLWGLDNWSTSFSNDNPMANKDGILSQWLKQLGYDLQLNTIMDQYTLNGAIRGKTSLKLVATANKIELDDVKTSYNGSELTGGVTMDVSETLPRVKLDVAADTLDTETFFNLSKNPSDVTAATATQNQPDIIWPRNSFDFHWLELLNANYRLHFGHFKYKNLIADAVDVRGDINEHTLNIEGVRADVYGAHVLGKTTLTEGKIPGINVALDITSLNLERVAGMLPLVENISGVYNVNIRLNTTGIDMLTWVSNLEGGISISGRDVTVQGFNMPGIIQAVSYVRTVADILDVVKRAFPGGSTAFPSVTGQCFLSGGVIKTSNIRLSNAQTDGTLAFDMDIVNWKMQGHTVFALKALDPVHPPGITVNFSGPLNATENSIDTRSLEQYVIDKTSKRMLEQYGDH